MKQRISQESVMAELAQIAFAKATDYLTVENGVLTVGDLSKAENMAAVQSVEKTSTGLRIKFYDKLKALELLGKAMGLFDGMAPTGENNLLTAIVSATKQEVETDDLPELQ